MLLSKNLFIKMGGNLLLDSIRDREYDSILTLWKHNFRNNKSDTFFYDEVFGSHSKRAFIIKAYLLSLYIKKLEGKYIGIMMPALGTNSILVIAIYLSGKVPVMFNWTLGKDAFHHCFQFSKVKHILTSEKFYNKINIDFLDTYKQENIFLFLEQILSKVPLHYKVLAVIKSLFFSLPSIGKEEQAVLLFTSGTESFPKAVSLTHKNIIENLIGSVSIFNIKNNDILLGFLPPFHSFGYTVNTILPLIAGLQIIYSPNPNDAAELLRLIKEKKVTAMASTPTFFKMILSLARKDDLERLRYVVVGGERCSDEIYDQFHQLSPNGSIIEGYGITECSPVISINSLEDCKKGTVGKVIHTLKCKILNVETKEEMSYGKQGMIYVSGTSVFQGYLDDTLESPFENIEGTIYYKTGDIGYLDAEGYLTITGRLKRFVKLAGEMISLGYIESILNQEYGNDIAVEALEKDNKLKIVLFSLEYVNVSDVNKYLRNKEVQNIIKISENIVLDKIPFLGTGKIDYKILREMISLEDLNLSSKEEGSIKEVLKVKIKELIGDEKIDIDERSVFGKDIYMDSIDVGELMIFIRKKYHITGDINTSEMKTFGDLIKRVTKS